jgi:cyclophilin family peptidyl-prolyl cis-trans isomerase
MRSEVKLDKGRCFSNNADINSPSASFLAVTPLRAKKTNIRRTKMPKQWSTPPAMQIDPKKKYKARMETDKGTMVIELFADKAPKTVNNFVFLAREGYYEGVMFHRVISNFMVQGGDPTGTGSGGPGYKFEDEFHPSLRHDKQGVLSMANAGPRTNGSQFFITHTPTPHLDNKHSVFGQVVEGLDVLMSIPPRDPSNVNAPAVKINRVTIEESE